MKNNQNVRTIVWIWIATMRAGMTTRSILPTVHVDRIAKVDFEIIHFRIFGKRELAKFEKLVRTLVHDSGQGLICFHMKPMNLLISEMDHFSQNHFQTSKTSLQSSKILILRSLSFPYNR